MSDLTNLLKVFKRTHGAIVTDSENTEDALLRLLYEVMRTHSVHSVVDAFARNPQRYAGDLRNVLREVQAAYIPASEEVVKVSYEKAAEHHTTWLKFLAAAFGVELALQALDANGLFKQYSAAARGLPDAAMAASVEALNGKTPTAIRSFVMRKMAQLGLSSRTAYRTILMETLRKSNLRAYRHIPGIKGYRRVASKSPRTCAACIALDGKFYETDVLMEEHPNGRCQLVPVTEAYDPQWEPAWKWLESQPEDVQRKVLGPSRLAALKRGDLSWSDMAVTQVADDGRVSLSVVRVRDIGR